MTVCLKATDGGTKPRYNIEARILLEAEGCTYELDRLGLSGNYYGDYNEGKMSLRGLINMGTILTL